MARLLVNVYDKVTFQYPLGALVALPGIAKTISHLGFSEFPDVVLGEKYPVTVSHQDYETWTGEILIAEDPTLMWVLLIPKPGAVPETKYKLAVSASAGGSTDPAPGSYTYVAGSSVTVTSKPDAGYELQRWELDGVSQPAAPTFTVLMDRDHAVNAVFEKAAPPPGTFKLTVIAGANGSTSPTPGSYVYAEGSRITVTALPGAGYKVDRWSLDGAAAGSADSLTVSMDKDHTCAVYFTHVTAPLTTLCNLTVLCWAAGEIPVIANAKVTVNTLEALTDTWGKAYFKNLEPKTYAIKVTHPEWETAEVTITLVAGEDRLERLQLIAKTVVDPITGLINFLRGIWDMLLGALSGFAKSITEPMEKQIGDLVDRATTQLKPGSPEEELAVKTSSLAEEARKRQEELIRTMYKKSPALELAPGTAAQILSLFLGVGVVIEGVATAIDNIHPIRSTRILEVAQRVTDSLGFAGVTQQIAMMPTQVGLMTQLTYYWNKTFTPLIPSLSDLIVMLVREVITPDQYVELAAMHGESKIWADRRWETHWRLVAPEMVKDAYHRRIITREERDKFMVLHDYRPAPRPGIEKSDLAIIAGLQKELIPRVDLRRGWEMGLIDDKELLSRYELLGYEDDAPLMTEIQKDVALESERLAVVRAAGRCFRDGKVSESDFRELITKLKILGERQDLWVLRYLWERKAKPPPEEEAAEEITPAPTET